MTAKGPWDRRFAFTAPFMVRMSMAFLRFIGKGGGNQLSFTHVILQVKSNLVGFDFKIRILNVILYTDFQVRLRMMFFIFRTS